MTLFDCHTHFPSREGEIVFQQDVDNYGIHPWNITAENIDSLILTFDSKLINNLCKAVGECGLDKLCSAPFELQKRVFVYQIRKSEELGLPLILHCVKAIDEVLQIKREMKVKQSWIFHGFRGKPQQLQQLLSYDFYISFGFHYNIESLKACPLNKLFLETDDNEKPISLLYEQVAKDRDISKDLLCREIELNYNRIMVTH